MVACAAQAGPVTYFIVAALFDAIWAVDSQGSVAIRKEIFVANNGMTYGTLPPEDPDGIGVYYLEPEFWASVNAYFDEHGTACPKGCVIRNFSS